MDTLSSEYAGRFLALANGLSPENLTSDGEATMTQVIQRRKALMGQWQQLENAVGRKVSEDEVYQWTFPRT